ncbi:MAG: TonB-dependent receptor [Rhodoferax sp.]|nr:TonB-dependent receptor [Rhodoferax sp.]
MKFQPTPVAVSVAMLVLSAAATAQTTLPGATGAQTEEQAAATANTANRKPTTALKSVVITSSKRAEAAHTVPYNVSAITEEELRDNNITDIKKLIQQSVGISAPENSARFADSVTVRGLNISPVNANDLEYFTRSTLAYYLDDTPLPNIGFRIKDVARVETLLGPQGTLYGAGSLGGTVRYITNKPLIGKTEGRISTSFYQTVNGGLSNDTDAVVNLPLGNTMALRMSAARLDEAGYTDRMSTPPWRVGADAWTTSPDSKQNLYTRDNWQKVNGGKVALLWKVTPDIDVTLTHARQDQLAHGTNGAQLLPVRIANAKNQAEIDNAWKNGVSPCAGTACTYTDALKTPFAVNDHTILSRYEEFADRKFRMNAVDVDWNLGFAKLHSSTSNFTDSRIGQADYASQGKAYYFDLGDLGGAITSNRSAYVTFDNTYSGVSHETRLTSTGDGASSWIGGFYYTQQDKNLQFSEVLPGMDAYLGSTKAQTSPLPDVGYSENLGSKYVERALFGEYSYKVTPAWKVTAGGRVFAYSDIGLGKIVDYAGGYVDSETMAEGGTQTRSYYKLNTSYQLSTDMLTYLTFSQGFRRGGTNGFKDQGAKKVADDARNYGPDSTNNVELGLKGYMLDRQLYLETSIYQIDWKSPQVYRAQLVSDFPVNGSANGPDARTKGWEFSSRYKINDTWKLSYSTSTTEGVLVDTKTHCIYANGTECRTWAEGGLLGGSPKWKHNLGLSFNTTVGDENYVWGGVRASYQSGVRADRADTVAGNEFVTIYPAFTRYSANLGVSRGQWDASLWVENLTDQRAIVSTLASAGLMGSRVFYTTPRTVGMNLSYNFK